MIHIVFSEADGKVLQEAMSMDESFTGEILTLQDDYSVGPIADIYSEYGREARKTWWKEVMSAGDPKQAALWEDDHEKMIRLTEQLQNDPEQTVWIWAAQNKHDVCGYYWTLPFLKEFKGRISILYLNNLPFINEKGAIFYPAWLWEIPAKEFLKARKLAREITPSEFEVDPDEWTRLCNSNMGVRLLEGGKKIVQEDYDFYDSELRRFVMPDWQKAGKVIHNFQQKAKNSTGEAYLTWRLKVLVANGRFDTQGNTEKIKDLELKTKAAAPALND
jgi:hypothetical protein